MPVDRIYIARHGFRMNWQTQVWFSPTGFPRDPPLTSHGEDQARDLASYFLSLPASERPHLILSSPYYRCLQTSRPVSRALGLPIYIEPGLAEWYPPAKPGTGLHPRAVTAREMKEFVDEVGICRDEVGIQSSYEDGAWAPLVEVDRKGETVEEIHARTAEMLRRLLAKIDRCGLPGDGSNSGEKEGAGFNVLLVTHAATNIALGRALLGDTSTRRLKVGTGCATLGQYDRQGEREVEQAREQELSTSPASSSPAITPPTSALPGIGQWKQTLNGSATHLPRGVERDWSFDDVPPEPEEDGMGEDGEEEEKAKREKMSADANAFDARRTKAGL